MDLTEGAPLRKESRGVIRPVSSLGENPILDQVIIGVGASTGGTEAVIEVLRRLPRDIPAMVIVQHMPPYENFTTKYAERVNRLCQMEVCQARNGEELRRGHAYIAPADLHTRIMRIDGRYRLSCSQGAAIGGQRPSVNAFFQSMADNVSGKMVGIIMTGMGEDGAEGLLAMRQRGAYTIGQDRESSAIYGMPQAAYKIGAVAVQASCENIASVLLGHLLSLIR